MHIILANTRIDVQLNIQISQGSVAINLRCGKILPLLPVRFTWEYRYALERTQTSSSVSTGQESRPALTVRRATTTGGRPAGTPACDAADTTT